MNKGLKWTYGLVTLPLIILLGLITIGHTLQEVPGLLAVSGGFFTDLKIS